jgi:hypothetical protein
MISFARRLQFEARPLQIRGTLDCDVEGVDEDASDGTNEGCWVGDKDGDGDAVGSLGNEEGITDGKDDGSTEPLGLGDSEGICEGAPVVGTNESDGCREGILEGAIVGSGDVEGCNDGVYVGSPRYPLSTEFALALFTRCLSEPTIPSCHTV